MVNLATYDAMLQATQNGHYNITEILARAGANPELTVKYIRSEYLGAGMKFAYAVTGDDSNPGPALMAMVENNSPWHQDGRYVRPSDDVLATARASVVPTSTSAEAPVATSAAPQGDDDEFARLRKLKELLDDGIITQEDFDKQKAIILNKGTGGQ